MDRQLIIKNGLVLQNNGFDKMDIMIADSFIREMGERRGLKGWGNIMDVEGLMVLPGLIDIHTHGGNGIDISNGSEEELGALTSFYASQGVTGFLATVLTAPQDELCETLRRIHKVKEQGNDGAAILGIHMEGPFLSKEFKGAMPGELIVPCSIEFFEEYIQASGQNIRLITIAPESENAMEFIQYAIRKGVAVSIGHSGASYELCMECIDAGITSASHLFNAMQLLHQHRPSVIGACLESDIFCELICDGRHLHPGIVRLAVKTKGMDRVIAVTDSIMAAGLGDGRYKLGNSDIIVEDGDAKLAQGFSRAGSTLTMIEALKNLTTFTRKSIPECVKALTSNPAKLLGIEARKGTIEVGKDADLTIIDGDFNVHYTIVGGKKVYQRDDDDVKQK